MSAEYSISNKSTSNKEKKTTFNNKNLYKKLKIKWAKPNSEVTQLTTPEEKLRESLLEEGI